MKIYAGTRVSETPGDVDVRVHHKVAVCPSCHVEVQQDTKGNYPHFDRTYRMCTARIDASKSVHITEEPLLRRTHSEPTGFEWSDRNRIGSKNLAIALLWDVLGNRPDAELVNNFTRDVILKLEHNNWSLSELEIKDWIARNKMRGYILAS